MKLQNDHIYTFLTEKVVEVENLNCKLKNEYQFIT